MQALNSTTTTTQNGSSISTCSSNSNSSVDDTHEHNIESPPSSLSLDTGMSTDQPQSHQCYHHHQQQQQPLHHSGGSIENGATTSAVCSQPQQQQHNNINNNNTIAINNNNCDTIKNNNQTLTAPLEMLNDVEAVPTAAVALIDQQNALLRGVNIGKHLLQPTELNLMLYTTYNFKFFTKLIAQNTLRSLE